MKINISNRRETPNFNNTLNSNMYYNDFNQSGKIMEKLIIINNENNIPKEQKIREFEIVIKNPNVNEINITRKKSNNMSRLNRIPNLKKPPNKEPYLKPKFQVKNKNSFSIKNKNNNINFNNNTINHDEIKNIYLNFFKVYYDENGKKVKIIKNKSNYKENKSKEIILTQKNNIYINNDCIIDRNSQLRKNYTKDIFDTKLSNNDNFVGIKYISPESPSQSTTIENKSNTKSGKNKKIGEIQNINKNLNIFDKENINLNNNQKNSFIKKNICYDNLPLFLIKRRNQKKNDKKFKKKNIDKEIYLNNTEKSYFLDNSIHKLKKLKNGFNQDLLITKINNNTYNTNSNSNNDTKISFNHMRKNNSNIDLGKAHKINYFHNDISNLTLNMTFEQKNISNTINSENAKVIKKEIPKINPICLNNNFENINLANKTIDSRHTVGNYILFNFFKDNDDIKELNRNRSFGYQNIKNYNLNTVFDVSNFNQSNSSFNNAYGVKYNYSNTFKENNNQISLLNKTKEILKIKEDSIKKYSHMKRKSKLNDSLCLLDFAPKSFMKIKKNKSSEKINNKINEKLINIPNTEYYQKTKIISDNIQRNLITKDNLLNKNKRPCSLYSNKKMGRKEKNIKNNCILNKYYNNAINKDTHLNIDINNINKNIKNINPEGIENYQYNNIYIKEYNENEVNKNNKKNNIKYSLLNNKYKNNLNQNSSNHQFINKRIKINNIFYFNRKKNSNEQNSLSNSSLNYFPSCIKINKNHNNE